MKIAISGKGGVGKTTLSALMARRLAKEGRKVLAVDADADANLATALGIDISQHDIQPIAQLEELIAEKMGTGEDVGQGLYVLNPNVSDIPDRFAIEYQGVRFLAVGTVKTGGTGCYCAENKLIKRLINHLMLKSDEAVIIDMEAGLEHLSRGTGEGVDALIVVVEPGMRSIQTAKNIKSMADEIGIESVYGVASKVRSNKDLDIIKEKLKEIQFLGAIPYDEEIIKADLEGRPFFDFANEELLKEVDAILQNLNID
ncbi:ATP-binding protein [Selenihalanaerobacter shriftii]|uniref:CO dehydrogenase maturation factor n=1 Tax=Selenihalanaerobacter shriftii TaxID=142842 RepID=A0A1T4K8M7_9FIRM|nr:AAA family ATPase [Selenihalanaerobacter shriftii]SJZ38784.1 CO dehydrogenase maturation factor [Selenihalanaerobacter shriftii]